MLWFKSLQYSSSNKSDIEGRAPLTSSTAVAFQVLFVVISVLNVVGNSLVLFTIMRTRSLQSSIHWLLVNITFSDIILAGFLLPRYVFLQYLSYPEGVRSDIVCKLLSSLTVSWVGIYAQVFTLIVIAIERYVVIVHRHRARWTKTTLRIVIASSWIYAIGFNIPDLIFIRYGEERGGCIYAWSQSAHGIWALVRLFACGPLPLVTMVFLYVRVAYDLWIKNHNIVMDTARLVILASRKRFTRIVITISIIYGLCLIPNMTIWLVDNFIDAIPNFYVLLAISHLILLLNATVKPLVYCIQSEQFRKCMLAMLWKQNSVTAIEAQDFRTEYGSEYPRSERSLGSNVYQTRQASGITQESHYELENCTKRSLQMRHNNRSVSTVFSEESNNDSNYKVNNRYSRASKGSLFKDTFYYKSKTSFANNSNNIINFDSSDSESDDDLKELNKIRYGGIWLGSKENPGNAWPEVQFVSPSTSERHSVELHNPPASSINQAATSASEHCEEGVPDRLLEKPTVISISEAKEVQETSEDRQMKPLESGTTSNKDSEPTNKSNKDNEEERKELWLKTDSSTTPCSSLQPSLEGEAKHANTVLKMEVMSASHTKEIAVETTDIGVQQNISEKRNKNGINPAQTESAVMEDNSQNTGQYFPLNKTSLNGIHDESKKDVSGLKSKVQNSSENIDDTTRTISLDEEENADTNKDLSASIKSKADTNIANGDLPSITTSQAHYKSERESHFEETLSTISEKEMEMTKRNVEDQKQHLDQQRDTGMNAGASLEDPRENSPSFPRQDHDELQNQFGGIWLGPANPGLSSENEEALIDINFTSSGSQKIQDDYGGIWMGNIQSEDINASLEATIALDDNKEGIGDGQYFVARRNSALNKRAMQTAEDEKNQREFTKKEHTIETGLSQDENINDRVGLNNDMPVQQNNTSSNSSEEQKREERESDNKMNSVNQLKEAESTSSFNPVSYSGSSAPKKHTKKTTKAGQTKTPALNKIKGIKLHLKTAPNSINPSENLTDVPRKEAKYSKGKQVWLREKDKLKVMNRLKYLDINS